MATRKFQKIVLQAPGSPSRVTLQPDYSGALLLPTNAIADDAVTYDKLSFRAPRFMEITLTGVVAITGGAVGSAVNPVSGSIMITRAILRTTAFSTGAANLDIGIAANATTSNDTLLDGIAVGTAVKVADNINDAGTNGKARQLMTTGQYITVTGSADSSGLAGKLYVEYFEV
jgi:hypothetical protein